jgi:hypothetical protein
VRSRIWSNRRLAEGDGSPTTREFENEWPTSRPAAPGSQRTVVVSKNPSNPPSCRPLGIGVLNPVATLTQHHSTRLRIQTGPRFLVLTPPLERRCRGLTGPSLPDRLSHWTSEKYRRAGCPLTGRSSVCRTIIQEQQRARQSRPTTCSRNPIAHGRADDPISSVVLTPAVAPRRQFGRREL